MKPIQTSRLLLRPFTMDDLDDFYEYAKVPGVGEAAGWPHHKSREESRTILEIFIKKDETYAVTLKDSGKVIGTVGIHHKSFDDEDANYNQREIGYVLAKNYWGQGLMSEAVKAVIDMCFTAMNLDRLTISHFKGNDRSRRVIEKMGFSFVTDGTYYSESLNQTFDDMKYVLYKNAYHK